MKRLLLVSALAIVMPMQAMAQSLGPGLAGGVGADGGVSSSQSGLSPIILRSTEATSGESAQDLGISNTLALGYYYQSEDYRESISPENSIRPILPLGVITPGVRQNGVFLGINNLSADLTAGNIIDNYSYLNGR